MTKRYWLILTVVLVLLASLLVSACAKPAPAPAPAPAPTPTPAPAPVKPIELTYNKMGPTTQENSQKPAEYLCSEIEKRTEGRVKVILYPNSTLAAAPETFDATIKGVSDIGESVCTYNAGRFPAMEAFDSPLGWGSCWLNSHVVYDFYNHFTLKELADVQVLYFFAQAPALTGTISKPVRTLADLKGLTMRASGGGVVKYAEALGAVPRAVPLAEAYEALAKAMVDGIFVPFEAYPAFKFQEVVKYVTDTSSVSYTNPSYVVMNKNSWNKISPQDQQTILKVGFDTMEMRGPIFDRNCTEAKTIFLTLPGREFITLSPEELAKFKAALSGLTDQYIKDKTAMGLPAADYVKYLQERIAYWSPKQPK